MAAPTVYEWAGGAPALRRLTDVFYARVREDDVLAPVFRHMGPQHQQHVADWLGEVFGGPPVYTEDPRRLPGDAAPTTWACRSPRRSGPGGRPSSPRARTRRGCPTTRSSAPPSSPTSSGAPGSPWPTPPRAPSRRRPRPCRAGAGARRRRTCRDPALLVQGLVPITARRSTRPGPVRVRPPGLPWTGTSTNGRPHVDESGERLRIDRLQDEVTRARAEASRVVDAERAARRDPPRRARADRLAARRGRAPRPAARVLRHARSASATTARPTSRPAGASSASRSPRPSPSRTSSRAARSCSTRR